jgi:hypothetical protein
MITRDNYEEFFLLYADNELSAVDRQLVERFVTGNPDLKEEWEALLQCRVEPERIVFPGKEDLMKGVDDQEDHFLSYIDGELNEGERVLFEDLLLRDPSKRAELEKWQATISEPDMTIVFPDKESLYRKENDRRALPYPWWRVAAAAILLIVAGGTFFRLSHNDRQTAGGPAITPHVKKDTLTVTPATTAALYSSVNREKKKPVQARDAGKNKKEVTEPVIVKPAPTEPAVVSRKITRPDDKDNAIAVVDPPKTDGNVTGPEKITALVTAPVTAPEEVIPKEKSSFASQALLNNSAVAGDDNPGTEMSSSKKNKLRGIFRRVTRAFEKTADRDDDNQRKVLIGNFQFALK